MLINSTFGPKFKKYQIGNILNLAKDNELPLDCGKNISNFNIAYQTYGKLNKEKTNAILICHAFTGDQYVASNNPITGKEGWWNEVIGKDKAVDTAKYFVICSNVIGSCMGSFGPKDVNPEDGKIYGANFPIITISDMVRAQKLLIDHLEIKELFSVIGGSMGGFQVLEWAASYPEMVRSVIPLATSFRHNVENIAFNEIGRKAIMADSDWRSGNYLEEKTFPEKGLAVARMAAHITYMSKASLQRKFGRNLQEKRELSYQFDIDFQIESYLDHQGSAFISRYDPNSYLFISKAMDYFDLEKDREQDLTEIFSDSKIKFCLISFSDDWLFPPSELQILSQKLNIAGLNVSYVNIESYHGHDSFLVKNESMERTIKGFLNNI
ncbi:MAG: homoserine O-acetyltransferase [Rickettsiales bacterium]|jgi:homoserine O-acetyltransferase